MRRYLHALVLAVLFAPVLAHAADRVLHPELYEPLTAASFDYVAVKPNGPCHDGGVPGVSDNPDAGPRTCWATEAPWTVLGLSPHMPARRGVHESATNAATIGQVHSLIDTVGLDVVKTRLAGRLALGLHPTPTIHHVVWASFVLKASGARKASLAAYPGLEVRVYIPALEAGELPIDEIVSISGPYQLTDEDGGVTLAPDTLPVAAVGAAQVLVSGYVEPAMRAETGFRAPE